MPKKYYAVKTGKTPGIYENWDDCKAQVDGFSKAEFKSFKTLPEACQYLGIEVPAGAASPPPGSHKAIRKKTSSARPLPEEGCAIAYVDGSFSAAAGKFSYGVVLFLGDGEFHYARAFRNPDLLLMRNVAGEIMGSGQAMKKAREAGCKKLTIHHDYEGIAKWCTGEWKTNKDWTKAYKKFYDEISRDVEISFVKVKAHSNDPYNDLADALAKEALSSDAG